MAKKSTNAKLPAKAAGPPNRARIFQKLQRAFTADGQNGKNVRPEMVLGQAPLGYDRPGLDGFYDIYVNPGFGVTITTGIVGTDKTVDALLDEIIAQGGVD